MINNTNNFNINVNNINNNNVLQLEVLICSSRGRHSNALICVSDVNV